DRAGVRDRDRCDRRRGGWICLIDGKERRPLAAARLIRESAGPQLRCRRSAPVRNRGQARGPRARGCVPRAYLRGENFFVKFDTTARVGADSSFHRVCAWQESRKNFTEFEDAT